LQKFFAIYGPFDTLFGTIVWFNYNIAELPNAPNQRVTGLFNNPNYLGMWLSLCLPFGISLLKLEKRKVSKIVLYIINIFIIYFAIATNSRNALLGILISILLIFGIRRIIYFSFFLSAGLVLFNILLPNFINFNDSYLYTKLVNFNLIARMNIWQNAINLINQQPLLGWGAGTFPYLNKIIGAVNYQHTHNLFMELAYNFGIPLAFLVSFTVISIFIKSFNKIKRLDKSSSEYSIYTTFFASLSVFLIAHMTDVTYYDGRISLIFAVLLAGFLNFIEEKII
jgi:O-antigen ligase